MAKDIIKRSPKILRSTVTFSFNDEKYKHIDISIPNEALPGVNYYLAENHALGVAFINAAGGLVTISCYDQGITKSNGSAWIRAITPNNVTGSFGVNIYWIPIE